MPRFRDSGEFGPTLDAAAERIGISATAVEKDYWVSEVLRVLASDFGGDFIFKGGTSLSKGYRIVERFSEDIDILVLPGGRGRGGQDPHEPAAISCLLGDILETAGTNLGEFADLEPFEVVVLHPGRTLLEKLILIHALAQRPETGALRPAEHRSGRHFYDIYQLLGDHRVLDLLAGHDQMMQVIASVQEIDRTYFNASDDTELRPKDGFAASPAFDPGTDVSLRLRAGYEATVPEL